MSEAWENDAMEAASILKLLADGEGVSEYRADARRLARALFHGARSGKPLADAGASMREVAASILAIRKACYMAGYIAAGIDIMSNKYSPEKAEAEYQEMLDSETPQASVSPKGEPVKGSDYIITGNTTINYPARASGEGAVT